mgnify:CR=1 FL=1
MAFCQNCGAKLEEGVRFCPNCGSAVEGNTAGKNGTAGADSTRTSGTQTSGTTNEKKNFEETIQDLNDTEDTTDQGYGSAFLYRDSGAGTDPGGKGFQICQISCKSGTAASDRFCSIQYRAPYRECDPVCDQLETCVYRNDSQRSQHCFLCIDDHWYCKCSKWQGQGAAGHW